MSTTLSTVTPAPSRGARFIRYPLVRIVLAAVALILVTMLTFAFAKAIAPKPARIMWPQLLATAAVLLTYIGYVRWIEKRAPDELSRHGALRELGVGCGVGAGAVAAVVGVLYAAGAWHPVAFNPWSLAIVAPVAEMLFGGVLEELLFRAILFRIVEQWTGTRVALLVSSVLFGLAHVPNEGMTVLAVANTVAAGAMFGAAYMLTRRLWLCVGIHAAWNYTLGSIFSIAVSGYQSKAGLVDATVAGPDWLTGGAYGLEASAVTLLVLIVLTAAFLWPRKAPGPTHIA